MSKKCSKLLDGYTFGIFQWVGTACIIGMIVLVALTSKDSQPLQKEKPLKVS